MPAALPLSPIRTLDLVAPSRPGRPSYVTAASGLVRAGRGFYVVADDELHLGMFRGQAPGRLVRLFEGKLPLKPRKRKRKKPDLEGLAALPDGSLLALPSGSRKRRIVGARLALSAQGSPIGRAASIDFGPLYATLSDEFDELNIEGAAVSGAHLVLLQRGNGPSHQNGVIFLDLRATLARLARDHAVTPRELERVAHIDLGETRGVPFGFTDACALDDGRVAFVAAAEARDSTYEDGECVGSMFGILRLDPNVAVVERRPLARAAGRIVKPEGLWIAGDRAWIVTDADDLEVPSVLYETRL